MTMGCAPTPPTRCSSVYNSTYGDSGLINMTTVSLALGFGRLVSSVQGEWEPVQARGHRQVSPLDEG